uniref:Glucuronosyltransferase n=1 Tax=Scleropages formosus TaxID=113540 RepID=A0A8C9TFX2_SCLFO
FGSVFVLTPLLLCSPGIGGGKVLVFPMDGSHWINMKVLVEELHARGHNITVIVPSDSWYINKNSSYYNSVLMPMRGGYDERFIASFASSLLQIRIEGASFWTQIKMSFELIVKCSEMHYHVSNMIHEMFQDSRLMQSLQASEYDLVLTDPATGGGVLLAHRLGLPLVLNVRWTLQGEGHFAIAPSPLSYVPFPGSELTDNMSFVERVQNVLIYFLGKAQLAIASYHYTSICQQYFGSDADLLTLTQGADIWLMRNDFVFEFPRPTMPNVVYMGGFQCKPPKPLPTDLEEFVQSSGEHGVIIMSLGTIFGELPHDITEEIAAAFAQLPQKVIWRHRGKRPASLGNNTLLVKWMPQNDLLGHPKTRAFVAHGGTNGIQEAIYHGVPIVGLPLVFDQPDNLSRMKAKGVAKIVDIATMDRNTFLQAVQEVLHDPSYRIKMQHLSRLHRDQPMKPLDRAMFWIEFVMRHKGAAHLRTESYKMPWYAYHSVDVIVVLFAFVSLVVLCTTAIVKYMCYKIRRRIKKKHKENRWRKSQIYKNYH